MDVISDFLRACIIETARKEKLVEKEVIIAAHQEKKKQEAERKKIEEKRSGSLFFSTIRPVKLSLQLLSTFRGL